MFTSSIRFLKQFFWIVPFLSFFAGYQFLNLFIYTSSITTPCVVGMPIAKALQTLSAEHLNVRLLRYKEDPHVEADTVLSQNPSAASSIRKQQTVLLTVSTAPEKTLAPACTGIPLEELSELLKNKKIRYTTHKVPSNYPKNSCIAQIPQPNTTIPESGMTLYAAHSDAFLEVIVPSFKNKTVTEVTDFLKEHDIPYTLFHRYDCGPDHTCTHCSISYQKPVAGSLISLKNPPTFQLQVKD